MKYVILIFIILLSSNAYTSDEQSKNERMAEIAEQKGEHSLTMAIEADKKGDTATKQAFLQKAEVEFTSAITHNPSYQKLYYDRAETRYHLAKYEEAIEDFDQYLGNVPNDASNTGMVLFMRGLSKSLLKPENVSGACSDFKKAEMHGQNIESINGLAEYCTGQSGWE